MDNPLWKLVSAMPPKLLTPIDNRLTRSTYSKIDNVFIGAQIKTNGNRFSRKVNGVELSFYCPTVETWKMVYRWLDSETPVLDHMEENIHSNNHEVMYDIGANIGTFTCYLGRTMKQIVAFEPYPPTIEVLRQNVRLNNISVAVEEIALSNRNSTVTINIPTTNKAGVEQATILDEHPTHRDVEKQIEVPSRRLDRYVLENDLPEPDIVKIDVEGAGLHVLKGMDSLISKSPPHVYIEPHNNAEELKDYLRDRRYEITGVWPERDKDEHPTIVGIP